MIINENLTHIPPFKLTPIHDDNRYQAIELPTNLVEADTYTVSAEVEQTSNGTGSVTLRTYDGDIKTIHDSKICDIGEDGRVHLSFEYHSNKTVNFLFYTDVAKMTDYIGADYFNIKLEKGDKATPYIPHENSIETAKRQYFIGGGTSRKYILSHSNIEQSSYRKEVAA